MNNFEVEAIDVDGTPLGKLLLTSIHPIAVCAGRGCVIHHPSNHHMRSWLLVWSERSHDMFRRCPHGKHHPDPDALSVNHLLRHDADDPCDGCCFQPRNWINPL